MAVSELRLIKSCAEFLEKDEINNIPPYTRGIYALLRYKKLGMYDVVYIGMAGGEKGAGIRGRLRVHKYKKGELWTHCSVFEVWDNIREEEVRELEGILRHIYRKDPRANSLAKQKSFGKLTKIRHKTKKENWMKQSTSTAAGQ
jgi:hypothetical protein